jgi:hypothetical protein
MTVVRAIYSGMGIADDPDIDDYYSRAQGFPITYSPYDDPEVGLSKIMTYIEYVLNISK